MVMQFFKIGSPDRFIHSFQPFLSTQAHVCGWQTIVVRTRLKKEIKCAPQSTKNDELRRHDNLYHLLRTVRVRTAY